MDFLRDLRLGFRLLQRAPGFAATAILTLALGIGATTALFTVVNAVLLEPLPFPGLEQIDPGVAQRAAGADLRLGVVRALSRLAAAPARLHRPRRLVAARLHARRTARPGTRARRDGVGLVLQSDRRPARDRPLLLGRRGSHAAAIA